jgi:molybdopterin-guanine dinucleotide biosynthesis protein A
MASEKGITTVVMAGGKSSRMGTDKAFVPLLGKPLIEHVLERIGGIGQEEIIITNQPEDYEHLNRPMFQDIIPKSGPLGGLHTALVHANYPYILVTACDMPWLNRSLLEYMVSLRHRAQAIVPRWHDFPEPLHAVYSKSCLVPIEEQLTSGSFKMISFYEDIEVHFLDEDEIARFDPQGRSFSNINTPDDLARADNKN